MKSRWRKTTERIGEVGEEADWISTLRRYALVLETGRVSVTEPFDSNWMRRRARYSSVGLSHVNSPDLRNPANATRNATLRLIPSYSSLISSTIYGG